MTSYNDIKRERGKAKPAMWKNVGDTVIGKISKLLKGTHTLITLMQMNASKDKRGGILVKTSGWVEVCFSMLFFCLCFLIFL